MRQNGDDDYGLPHVDVVVPDDPAELAADIDAYLRERRRARRRLRLARLARPFTRYGLAAPLIVGALLVALVSGTLMTVFGPRAAPRPAAPPLVRSTAGPGQIGGTLPQVILVLDGHNRSATDLRPAVVTIVPDPCTQACADVVRSVEAQASLEPVKFALVQDRTRSGRTVRQAHPDLRRLAGGLHRARPVLVDDPANTLARTYQADGVTVLLVHANGMLLQVTRELTAVPPLELDRLHI